MLDFKNMLHSIYSYLIILYHSIRKEHKYNQADKAWKVLMEALERLRFESFLITKKYSCSRVLSWVTGFNSGCNSRR